MARSLGKKPKERAVDERLARKLEGFGRLAAFLDGFDGHPLDGVIAFFQQGMPMGFTKAEAECIRRGYHKAGAIPVPDLTGA